MESESVRKGLPQIKDLHNVKIVTFDRLEDNIRKLKSYHSW